MKVKIYTSLFLNFFLLFLPVKSFTQCTPAVNGNIYYVTTPNDFAPGSLREAIMNANADNVGGIIDLNTSSPLYLNAMLPAITCDSLLILPTISIVIDGQGIVNEPGVFINAPHTCLGTNVSGINFNGSTFVVTNTNDSGTGSLRQAMAYSNFSNSSDAIHFNIPGQAPHRIEVNSVLPVIRNPLSIDGTTQPANGYGGSAPKIELDGMNGSFIALRFNYTNLVHLYNASAYGLYIHGFSGAIATTASRVFNCGAPNKRNVISGNGPGGALAFYADSILYITNNYIGTDTSGTSAEGNDIGIMLTSIYTTSQNYITNNVISGNNTGVRVFSQSYNYIFKGNYVGTDKTGSYAIPNVSCGIECSGTNVTFGGPNPGDGNLFSGNCTTAASTNAALLLGGGSNSVIIGNKFGTNLAGTAAIPNANGRAIYCLQSHTNFRIGGTTLERNIISASRSGIVGSSRGLIKNNYIGTDVTGTVAFPNYFSGIESFDLDSVKIENNLIVGNGQGISLGNLSERDTIINNTIYNSVAEGIYNAGTNNWFTHNSIYDNGARGIYNYNNANTGIQKPLITSCTSTGVGGTALPFAVIEIFYSQSINIFPQGKTYIAAVTADATGIWSYSGFINDPIHVTATQTDSNNNTSEFADLPFTTHLQSIDNASQVYIFPNPTTDRFTIYVPCTRDRFTIESIEIYSLVGENIFSQKPTAKSQEQFALDISFLTPGIYFVTLTDENKNRITKRFVKM